MTEWKPNTPYNVQALLQVPTKKTVKGVEEKSYNGGSKIYVSFRTFGGTEQVRNGVLSVEKTGVVETWYRPDIKSDCRLVMDGVSYEILGAPENINMRNQYLVFKVRAVTGGA